MTGARYIASWWAIVQIAAIVFLAAILLTGTPYPREVFAVFIGLTINVAILWVLIERGAP